MKAAVWYSNADIRIEDLPTPKPGPNEILVKVVSCGICGSDVVEWYRGPRAPLVQGHEIGGEIVAVGRAVKDFRPGDRVCVAPKVPCLDCDSCRNGHTAVCPNVKERLPGGFAQYVLVPEIIVNRGTYRLPDELDFDQSTFIEPLACVVRSQNLLGLRGGQSLLVMGCGMSGLLQIKLAKAKGLKAIATDIFPGRLAFARDFGADVVIDARADVPGLVFDSLRKKADGIVLCTASLAAIDQAWACLERGGAIVFFAVPGPGKEVVVPIHDFWMKEIRILTSYYCGPSDLVEAINLLQSGGVTVDDMISHRLPLKDTAEGFRLVLAGRESLKVIIKPNEDLGP